jgi:flagellin
MLGITAAQQKKSSEKLSSGYKINRAADDAAGLAISEKMRRQIRGLSQASLNAQDGISLVQAAEGALHEVHDMLQRMSELTVKAANDTYTTEDRDYIQDEIKEITAEINRIGATTSFNERKLFTGSFSRAGFQVGADNDAQARISIKISKVTASVLLGGSLNVKKQYGSQVMPQISKVKAAIVKLNKRRSLLGSIQNRLEHTVNNLDNIVENTQAAESQIRDTDMAAEMVKFSNNNILAQAGQAMLANSNQANQGVLSLLQ